MSTAFNHTALLDQLEAIITDLDNIVIGYSPPPADEGPCQCPECERIVYEPTDLPTDLPDHLTYKEDESPSEEEDETLSVFTDAEHIIAEGLITFLEITRDRENTPTERMRAAERLITHGIDVVITFAELRAVR